MLHKNIVHDLFVSFLRLYIMKRKVKGLMLFQRQTQIFLTQMYTDGLRWDTDIFYYIICALSVLILFICGLFSDEEGSA